MDRDRVLYHFSEEGDITYCSGEGQGSLSMALRENGNSVMARDRVFSPSPYGASRDYSGEGQDSLSLALRENGN